MVYLAQIELDFGNVGFTGEGGKESKYINKMMVPSLVCRYQRVLSTSDVCGQGLFLGPLHEPLVLVCG